MHCSELLPLKPRPPAHFSAVPDDASGNPINVCRDKDSYALYLEWLADYLYRPGTQMPASAHLSADEAWRRVGHIESEIATWIEEHFADDYPPDGAQPSHADILHRRELSKILSRVPDHTDRRELLDSFYCHLNDDMSK